MNENYTAKETYITISTERYAELIRAQERVAIIERMIASSGYINTSDIAVVLDVKLPERKG